MLIKNVVIVNHNKRIDNANITIENGLITKIEPLPGKGEKIVIPGFIEGHIHGFSNYDCMDGKKAILEIAKNLKNVGVTSFFPTLMTAPWAKIIEAISEAGSIDKTNGAKVLGIHLEGPFISHAKKGAHNPEYIIKATKEKIKELHEKSNHKLKRITFAPEVNDMSLIKYLQELDITVLVGHTNASAKTINEAQINGASGATHLWNGMSGVVNRNPGAVQEILQNHNLYAEIICDLVHVDQNTLDFSIKNKGTDRVIVVSDSIAPAGLKDGKYSSGGMPVIKKGNVITLANDDKAIAGGASSIDLGFKNLLQNNYSLEDIVKMTSYNIAKQHRINNIGAIAIGFAADLIILNQDYTISKVLIDGK